MITVAGSADLGTLAIVVLKAKNLPDKHTFSKQDPFTRVELGTWKQDTKIDRRGGQHPVWDDEFRVKISKDNAKANRALRVSCFAKEPKEDELIGSAELDLTDTLAKFEFDDWIKLEKDGAYRGEVYLEMTFFPTARPQPITRRPSKLNPQERLWRPPQGATPPYTSPYTSPPRRSGEIPPSSSANTSPRGAYLTPPKESRTPSPQSEPPLPPLPIDVNANVEHTARPDFSGSPNLGLSVSQDESKASRVPTILRPGGPGAKHRKRVPEEASPPPHTSGPSYQSPYENSLPSASAGSNIYGQDNAMPSYQPQPQPHASQLTHSLSQEIAQPRPQSQFIPQQQPSYQESGPFPQPRRESTSSTPPHFPGSYPQTAPAAFNFPEPSISVQKPTPTSPGRQNTYSYPQQTPIYPGGPVAYSNYQQVPQDPRGHSPAPSSRPAVGQELPDPEREVRLAARYSSPLPLPPGVSVSTPVPKPDVPPRPSESSITRSEPQQQPQNLSQTSSRADSPPSYSREDKGKSKAPPPSRTPDPAGYLERERRELERRHQEEEDEKLARLQAQEDEERARRQEEEDEEMARRLAAEEERVSAPPPDSHQDKYSERQKGEQKQRVETDEEFARRLARELNEDVVSEVRRSVSGGDGGGRRS